MKKLRKPTKRCVKCDKPALVNALGECIKCELFESRESLRPYIREATEADGARRPAALVGEYRGIPLTGKLKHTKETK